MVIIRFIVTKLMIVPATKICASDKALAAPREAPYINRALRGIKDDSLDVPIPTTILARETPYNVIIIIIINSIIIIIIIIIIIMCLSLSLLIIITIIIILLLYYY